MEITYFCVWAIVHKETKNLRPPLLHNLKSFLKTFERDHAYSIYSHLNKFEFCTDAALCGRV